MNADSKMKTQDSKAKLTDYLGVSVSLICAAHCLLTPFVMMCLPALGNIVEGDGFHVVIAIGVTIFGGISCILGFRKHKSLRILACILSGLGLVLLSTFILRGRISENLKTSLLFAGGGLLIYGHISSLRSKPCC